MAKEFSEGEFLKKKVLITTGKGLKIYPKQTLSRIHLDQLEFLPIFPYSELLIWMLPAPNVTDHSYFDSVYLKIFTAPGKLKTFVFYQCIVDLRIFFLMLKTSQICNTWIYRELGPSWALQTCNSALDCA